jgi:hypothetical protein
MKLRVQQLGDILHALLDIAVKDGILFLIGLQEAGIHHAHVDTF